MYALPDIPLIFVLREGQVWTKEVLESVGIEQSIRTSILTSWCTVSDFPWQQSIAQLDVEVAIADAIYTGGSKKPFQGDRLGMLFSNS